MTRWLCAICALLGVWTESTQADWAGLSQYKIIAEARMDRERIDLSLRFHDHIRSSHEPARLVADWIQFQDPQGKPLHPLETSIRSLNPDEIVEDNDPSPMYEVHAHFTLDTDARSLLLMPGTGLNGQALGLILLDRGVPVSDLAILDRPLSLQRHLTDPWLTHFDDTERIRRHSEPRSYLYVEPYEVRHEYLIRLRDLLPSLAFTLRDPSWVEPDERTALKRQLGGYLLDKNPLKTDGQDLKPQLDRLDFVGFERSGVLPLPEDQRLETAASLLGVVMVYLTESPARELSLRWDEFLPGQPNRNVSVIQGKESFDDYMTAARPQFSWSQDEVLTPMAKIEATPAVAKGGNPLDALQSLLHNTYRAFALREEEAVYDRLAKTLVNPLLEEIYLQQRRSLIQREQGRSGDGLVERIEVLESRILETPSPDQCMVAVRWKAQGMISHWGHSHPRNNLYNARLTLRQGNDGQWKIAALQFIEGASHGLLASQ